MRILWIGDAGVASGFSRVTHSIGERLVARGHDVHVLASMYTGDPYDTTLKLWRANARDQGDFKGRKRIADLLVEIEPEAIAILDDPWVTASLLYNPNDPKGMLRNGPIMPVAYMPIDGAPIAPEWLKLPVRPAMMSRWAQSMWPESEYVPHGVDTDTFRPVEERPVVMSNGNVVRTKTECKQALGFDPDGFLALRVDRNSWRKDFGGTWRALVPLMERHSDVMAHFHCSPNDPSGGPILPALFSRRSDLAHRFLTPKSFAAREGWAVADLVALYNAADVFVSTSMGEGFGLTIAEALACGVPVIAQDCSAISEVAGAGGLLIPPGKPITAPGGHELRLAEPGEFSAMLETIYDWSPSRRAAFGALGREHVMANFNWDRATDSMEQMLLDQASRIREIAIPSQA